MIRVIVGLPQEVKCKKFTIKGSLGILDKENDCEVCECTKGSHGADNNHDLPAVKEVKPRKNLDIFDNANKKIDKFKDKSKEDKVKSDEKNNELQELKTEKSNFEEVKKKVLRKIGKQKIQLKKYIEIFRTILKIQKISKLIEILL